MNPYIRWILYFPLVHAVSIFCKLTAPIACLFVTKRLRKDRVKIYGNEELAFDREYLWGIFELWGSHDNAHDELFFSGMNKLSWFKSVRELTVAQYTTSWWWRYVCRLLWIERNTAYGFSFWWWGLDEDQPYFQIKKDIPLGFGYFNSLNIGWKSHRSAPVPRRMYAGRIIGIRKK